MEFKVGSASAFSLEDSRFWVEECGAEFKVGAEKFKSFWLQAAFFAASSFER